jgi:hypothetical protein
MQLNLTGGVLIEINEDFSTGDLTIVIRSGQINEEPVYSSTDGNGGVWDLYRYSMYEWAGHPPTQVIKYNSGNQTLEVQPNYDAPYWVLMVYPLFIHRPVKEILIEAKNPKYLGNPLWKKVQALYEAPVELADT